MKLAPATNRAPATARPTRSVALGCLSAGLEAFSFGAPEFYNKLGCRRFARSILSTSFSKTS